MVIGGVNPPPWEQEIEGIYEGLKRIGGGFHGGVAKEGELGGVL